MAKFFATKPLNTLMQEANETGEHSLKRTLGPVPLLALVCLSGLRRRLRIVPGLPWCLRSSSRELVALLPASATRNSRR